MLFSIVRLLITFVGILIPALIIKVTNTSGNNLKYLYLIGATVPFLFVNLSLAIIKNKTKKEGDINA